MKNYYLFGTCCWTLLIAITSLAPSRSFGEVGVDIRHLDKVIHFTLYMILAFLASGALRKSENNELSTTRSEKLKYLWIVLLIGGYGFFLEVMQELMDMGRHFDVWDIIANIAGTFTGMIIFVKAAKN
ncbi:MAG: VanZ family protein [Saprospirales bacterium]|nr:MAG: VanZ family protein [Saprospirales bacterium]